jgi:hypothetical protein
VDFETLVSGDNDMSVSAPTRKARFPMLLGLIAALLAVAGCTLPASNGDSVVAISGPPQVRLASPQSNATYLEGVPVNIQAAVTNAGEDIDRVEVMVGGAVIATLPEPNTAGAAVFSITQTWPAAGPGQHTIGVTAFRGDGTSSQTASVIINVVDDTAVASPTPEPTEPEPTDEPQATDPPPPTDEPEPTAVPATSTPSVPTARFTTGINVRSGPGTVFDPPIGAFAPNQTAEILALNQAGSWLKVRYGTGEGWVFANLAEIEGSIANLPREAGPPTPVPTAVPPPTQPPATQPPATQVNLVIEPGGFGVRVPSDGSFQPKCGVPFIAYMTVRNAGTQASSTGLLQMRVVRVADGQVLRSSGASLVAVTLQPDGTHYVEYEFNVDVHHSEDHRLEFIVDVNNEIAETSKDDNRRELTYNFPQGNC